MCIRDRDPDEFIKNMGSEAFKERIAQAKNSFLFEIDVLKRNYQLEDPEQKTRFYQMCIRDRCGFNVKIHENIQTLIWDKLFTNVSLSALTGVLQVDMGYIAANEYAWDCLLYTSRCV